MFLGSENHAVLTSGWRFDLACQPSNAQLIYQVLQIYKLRVIIRLCGLAQGIGFRSESGLMIGATVVGAAMKGKKKSGVL